MDFHTKTVECLSLPPERRNQIYHHVLSGTRGLFLNSLERPASLATCRQIQREALPILFSSNQLNLHLSQPYSGCDPNMILRPCTGMFLRNMQAYMSHIVHINVHATIRYKSWNGYIELDVTKSIGRARSVCVHSCWRWTNTSFGKSNPAIAERSDFMVLRQWSTYFDHIYSTGCMFAWLLDMKHSEQSYLLRLPTIFEP